MAKRLIHLANRPDPLTERQLSQYALGHFEGAKLMPEHGPDHIAQLEAHSPGGFYMARTVNTTRDGRFPDKVEWLSAQWFEQVKVLEPMGCYVYQLDTEPNNQVGVVGAYVWQWWIQQGILGLRARLTDYWRSQGFSRAACGFRQARIKLYLGPLADGPGHWKEIEQEKGWWEAYHYIMSIPGMVQGLCVDSYWQYTKHSLLNGYGANCDRFHSWAPGWKIIVGEWGCSLVDEYREAQWFKDNPDNVPPAVRNRIETMMLESYGPWLRWIEANAPYVVAVAMFIEPGSVGWGGFEPSDRVLASL